MGRTGGKRDGYSSCMLRFTALYTVLAALLMVRSTVYAQCDQQLAVTSAPFSTSNLTCQSAFSQQAAWSRRINGTDTLDIVYIAPLTAGNWVGLGFSSTGKMDGSVGLIAVMNSSSSASATWWNLYSHSIGPLSDPSSFLHSSTVQYMSNGNVSISAVVNITAILAPNTPDSLLFALGPVSGSIPLQHSKYTSQVAKFAPAGTLPKGYKISTDHLRKAHAAVNIVGWGILLPVGAIIARYCRMWDPTWFYLHVTFQVLGFILIVAGLILGTNLYGRLKGLSGISRHRALGIFVFVLACLQILAIVLRPKKDAKLRRYWNWYHSWVGRIALLLAAVNILVGIHVAHEKRSVTVGYGVIAALEITAFLLLESLYWIKRSKKPQVPHHAPAFGYGDDV
ncbi:unnamed protein product [Sphagnum jensenii]|uniref:Cytochrome b561 and DOMON domain-containing protein n=1 Tax=Sphagnum jensenii TaxID=128206 RepID=A0ABP0WXL4_9BRYO